MPINHFSSDLPEALWWTQQQPMMEPTQKTQSSKHTPLISNHPNTTLWSNSNYPLYDHHHHHVLAATASMFCGQNTGFNLNLSQEDAEELDEPLTDIDNLYHQQQHHHHQQQQQLEREPMFEKPLTPSDVGKLNRLVIPKQHAEKYFPLGGSESVEKGLLLSFEDESGKCWRFRYSYWTSSQSYVLTKGWSRYVKEKRLNAGDVVLFERHRSEGDRLFIGWRRGAATASGQDNVAVAQPAGAVASNIGGGWTRPFYSAHPYPFHPHGHGSPLPYQTDCLHAESVIQQQTTPSGNSKKLRLFGVNLECQLDESEPPTPDGSSMSSQGQAPYQYYPEPHASNRHDHMDANFSRDVNQIRYRQG